MNKRMIWVIISIVAALLLICCCTVLVMGGVSAFFMSSNSVDEVYQEFMDEEEVPYSVQAVDPTAEPESVIGPSEDEDEVEAEEVEPDAGDEAALFAQMDQIQLDVESYRELPGATGLDRKFMTPEELNDRVINDFFADYPEEEVMLDLVELEALGLLDRAFDLYGFYLDLYSEQIAGFYDDETKEMVVVKGEGFDGNARMTYAHEYTHAMQDAAYDLDDGMGMNEENCEENGEYCVAVQALVEGDATLSEIFWFQQYASEDDQQDVIDFYDSYESPIFDQAPAFMQEDFVFPYDKGFIFVQSLFEQGGFQAINGAYENPPQTAEQILHPELYPHELAVDVDLPVIYLGSAWEDLGAATLGEWGWYLVLGTPYQAEWALDAESAADAAAGWGGDQYTVFFNAEENKTVLVSQSVWDSPAEQDEFAAAFETYGQNRWGRPSAMRDEILWELEDQVILLQANENSVYWIMAPDMETLQKVQDKLVD